MSRIFKKNYDQQRYTSQIASVCIYNLHFIKKNKSRIFILYI
jgi:hypothetical protein